MYNHWLNLTAGAVRFFKFGSPHQDFLVFEVCTPQSCCKLAKTLSLPSLRTDSGILNQHASQSGGGRP